MTVVLHGYCPDCGRSTQGNPDLPPLGAQCYSDTGERVVACVCGSRKPPRP
jgi:hypothetical protein